MAVDPDHPEREFETGKDEAWTSNMFTNASAWMANMKRMFDEYQNDSLEMSRLLRHQSVEAIGRNRQHVDKMVSDGQQHDNTRQQIATQALQNAVETANMVGKQAVRHADLSIDRQWNVDEVAGLTAKTSVQLDAFVVQLAAAVASVLKDSEKA